MRLQLLRHPVIRQAMSFARWHTISLVAVGAMMALSVFFVFRPPHYKAVKPPSTKLIEHQCATTPGGDLMPPEHTCEKP